MLDLKNDSEGCEEKIMQIIVSPYHLFDDAVEEILREDLPVIDFSVPSEVIFTGDSTQDYGGPSWEFLGMMMHEICDKLFKEEGESYINSEDKEALDRKQYYGAGLFFGKYAKPIDKPTSFHLGTQEFQFAARRSFAYFPY